LDQQIKQELVRHLEDRMRGALGRLEVLLDADERLRDICTEYEDVARCRGRLAPSDARDQEKYDEYTELLQDLEKELLSIFSEHRPS
jgi:hypothetical protein